MNLDMGNHSLPEARLESTPTSPRQSVLSSLNLRSGSLGVLAKSLEFRRGRASSKAA